MKRSRSLLGLCLILSISPACATTQKKLEVVVCSIDANVMNLRCFNQTNQRLTITAITDETSKDLVCTSSSDFERLLSCSISPVPVQ